MDLNLILAGVGGQGILSIAWVLDAAATAEGFRFKQAEVHGMAQRGGAVQSHLRLSRDPIWSDLIPDGAVDVVLSVEPLEALRYVHALRPGGTVIASQNPYVNIPDYPDLEPLLDRIAALPDHVLIDAARLARAAGNVRAENMVLLGAASTLLPFAEATLLDQVAALFAAKGETLVRVNQDAFRFGKQMAAFYRVGLVEGIAPAELRRRCAEQDPRTLAPA
ncbi:MAG: indolepyruvate oxidoreductase subunit beta [Deltaproteobacteria bacterium]|nr:indolepyruvate oxidoreductase subunit beta [Deltaproteobacteria bacterium]